MSKSLKGLLNDAIAKGGITLSPTTDYDDHFQDIDSLVDNMLSNRGEVVYTGEKSYAGYESAISAMSSCTCNTRTAEICDCNSRTTCSCNTDVVSCSCNLRTTTCLCNTRGICDCVSRDCCICQSRNGWPACPSYCGVHCHCNCRSAAVCTCNTRGTCNCVGRGACNCVSRAVCTCVSRTSCSCNTRTPSDDDVYE